mmetsp:Transcript_56146/g.111584  ORF Transcript_56146/g.111584 Transcript_56146/m.111584 type:complete len:129 (+) Transcript_56146:2-388(+)
MKTMFISEKMQQDPSGGGGNIDEIRNKRRDDPHDKASNEVPFSNGVTPVLFYCQEDNTHIKEKLQQDPNGDGDKGEIRVKRRDDPRGKISNELPFSKGVSPAFVYCHEDNVHLRENAARSQWWWWQHR